MNVNLTHAHTWNFGMFLLVPPSNASTGKNANEGLLMSMRKFCKKKTAEGNSKIAVWSSGKKHTSWRQAVVKLDRTCHQWKHIK